MSEWPADNEISDDLAIIVQFVHHSACLWRKFKRLRSSISYVWTVLKQTASLRTTTKASTLAAPSSNSPASPTYVVSGRREMISGACEESHCSCHRLQMAQDQRFIGGKDTEQMVHFAIGRGAGHASF
ncbi:MAG: hypothetical protein AAFR90_06425 [Pseudomonadota bacterium]